MGEINNNDIILSMQNITKIYSNGFMANKKVNFELYKGEIHALAGENGAGKSTLMKVLFGEEKPDEGVIIYKGNKVNIDSPITAINLGIGMVHQHFMLVSSMSVAENMVLGLEPEKYGFLDKKEAIDLTRKVSERYGLPIDPNATVRDLSVGLKQRVEILKALVRGADILILDEPTAVLTPQETKEIFSELKRLKELGHTVVFISHKLNEIKEICDRITIMRDGKTIAVKSVKDVSEQEISKLMVGREVVLTTEKKKLNFDEIRLSVDKVSYRDIFGNNILNDLSFDIRSGEILGVAGIEGNGQNEISELITGMKKIQEGDIKVLDKSINNHSVRQIREMGVSHISQDRMTYGVCAESGISDNVIADRYYKNEYKKGPLLDKVKIKKLTEQLIKEFKVKCDDQDEPVKMLSGGNIQKVVVAREFSNNPAVIIANQPIRGIDVGAAELVHKKLVELRDNGAAILLISADLSEIMDLSDRIIVLKNGRIVAEFPDAKNVSTIELGEYMLGIKTMNLSEEKVM